MIKVRTTFIRRLTELARKNQNICLVVGDLGYGVVEPFFQEFPDRSFNAGVAEQNMIGLSAGLASEGMHVFVYSIANFPTFRCAEQIRNDVAYHGLPVTIVTVGGGVAYGNLGYSHHAVQDYALIRTFPDMLIAAPGEPIEVVATMNYLIANPQPSYLRLGKNGEPNIRTDLNLDTVLPGCWLPIRSKQHSSNDVAIICTGATLEIVAAISDENVDIFTLPLWGMAYKNQQHIEATGYTKIVTVEDHLQDGGFGSWMLESLTQDTVNAPDVSICGFQSSICGDVGTQQYLRSKHGLDLTRIRNLAKP